MEKRDILDVISLTISQSAKKTESRTKADNRSAREELNKAIKHLRGSNLGLEKLYALESSGHYKENANCFLAGIQMETEKTVRKKIFSMIINMLRRNEWDFGNMGWPQGKNREPLLYLAVGLACGENELREHAINELLRIRDVYNTSYKEISKDIGKKVLNDEKTWVKEEWRCRIMLASTILNPANRYQAEFEKILEEIKIIGNDCHGIWQQKSYKRDGVRLIIAPTNTYYWELSHKMVIFLIKWGIEVLGRNNDETILVEKDWLSHWKEYAEYKLVASKKINNPLKKMNLENIIGIPDFPLPELIPLIKEITAQKPTIFRHSRNNLKSMHERLWLEEISARGDSITEKTEENLAIKESTTKRTYMYINNKGNLRNSSFCGIEISKYKQIKGIRGKVRALIIDNGPLHAEEEYLYIYSSVDEYIEKQNKMVKIASYLIGREIEDNMIRMRPGLDWSNNIVESINKRTTGREQDRKKKIEESMKDFDVILTCFPTTVAYDALTENKPYILYFEKQNDLEFKRISKRYDVEIISVDEKD